MKSIETKFAEAMDALRKAGKLETFTEKSAQIKAIEPKLNCALEILKEQKIRMHNGAADNGHDFSEGFVSEDPRKAQVKSYRALGLSKAEAREAAGLPRKSRKKLGLNEAEYRQYSSYVTGGIPHEQALIMASPAVATKLEETVRRGGSVPEFLESIR